MERVSGQSGPFAGDVTPDRHTPGVTFERLALGRRAEDEAARWYRRRGYRVVDRNWRCAEGEIDLVVVRRRAGLVVFVEVKARTTDRFGSAAEAVGEDKRRRLRSLALRYLSDATVPPRSMRFDVAAWDGGHLSVIEGAF